MDDGAIYHKEKDWEKKVEFLRTMRERAGRSGIKVLFQLS